MAEEKKNLAPDSDAKGVDPKFVDEKAEDVKAAGKSKSKDAEKKPNFFVRFGKKIAKICKDTAGELKKVSWTPRHEVIKSFKLVIATVVAVAVIIMVLDLSSSWLINSIAGLIG